MIFVSMLSSEMPCAEAARVKGGFRTYLWAETGLAKASGGQKRELTERMLLQPGFSVWEHNVDNGRSTPAMWGPQSFVTRSATANPETNHPSLRYILGRSQIWEGRGP